MLTMFYFTTFNLVIIAEAKKLTITRNFFEYQITIILPILGVKLFW